MSNKVTYRYGIRTLLNRYDAKSQRLLKEELAKAWGVTKQRVYQIIDATTDETIVIKSDQVAAAAKLFNVSEVEILRASEVISI